VQQAESSVSRLRSAAGGTSQQDHEASMHTPPRGRGKEVVVHPAAGAKAPSVHDHVKMPPVKERIRDTRGLVGDDDARNVHNKKKQDGVARGGRYDREEDRSPSPEPSGTRVFSQEICTAPFPPRFRQPTTLVKHSGETDPRLWLNDYCYGRRRDHLQSSSAPRGLYADMAQTPSREPDPRLE